MHDIVTSLRNHQNDKLPQRIAAKAQDTFLSQRLNYANFCFWHSVLTFSHFYHARTSFLLDCFNFSLCATLRMNPHCLVSLPPDHPLLCLHLCSLLRSYDVTAVLPLFSVVYVCVCVYTCAKLTFEPHYVLRVPALFIPLSLTVIILLTSLRQYPYITIMRNNDSCNMKK